MNLTDEQRDAILRTLMCNSSDFVANCEARGIDPDDLLNTLDGLGGEGEKDERVRPLDNRG